MPGVDAGTIYSEVRIALDKLSGDVSKVQASFDRITTGSKTASSKTEANFKKGFQGISLAGTAAMAAVTVAFKQAVSTFAKTEQSLANVRAVTGATEEEFQKLKEAVDEAGRTTRFTASQSADAMYYLASAGFDATQSVEALNGVLLLAGATGSDLANSAQAVTSTLSQFNLEAADSEQVVNVFAAAISNSQATLEKIQGSLRQVGPVAGGMNKTLEETVGVLQLLYNAGFQGENAGRALKSALADLGNESSIANQKLSKLGITFDQVNPATNNLADVFGILGEAGLETADVLDIFGKVAGPQVATLLSAGREEIEKYTEAVTGTNSAAEQYAIQNDTLSGSFDKFKSALEGTTNSIIEQLAPALRLILDTLASVLNFITGLPAPLKALGGGFGAAAIATGTLSKALSLLGVSATSALGPIGLIVGAVIGIGTAFYAASKEQREYNKLLKDTEEISKGFDENLLSLTTELARLEAQEKLTIDEQIRHGQILNELDTQYPELSEKVRENSLAVAENTLKQAEQNKVLKQQNLELLKKKYSELTEEFEKQSKTIRTNLLDQWNQLNARLLNNEETTKEAQAAQQAFYKELSNAKSIEDFQSIAERLGLSLQDVSLQAFYTGERISEVNTAISSTNSEMTIQEQIITEAKTTLAELTTAIINNNEALDKEGDILKDRTALWEAYQASLKAAAFEEKIGLTDTADLLQDKIDLTEEYIRGLIETGYVDEAVLGKFIKNIDEWKAQLEALKNKDEETTEERKTYAQGYGEFLAEEQEKEKQNEEYLQQYLKDKNKERLEEQEADEAESAANVKAIREELVNGSIALYQTLVSALNKSYQADKDNAIAAIKEKVEKGILTEEEGNKQIAQLQYEKALHEWKMQNLSIIGTVAQAIVQALASPIPFPGNLVPIAFATATGAIQLAAQAAAKPKPPALATGGIILPKSGGVTTIQAENGSPELDLNLGQEGNALLDEFGRRVANAGGQSGYMRLVINLDGRQIADNTVKYINNGVVEINI